jgi:hypothetical protein
MRLVMICLLLVVVVSSCTKAIHVGGLDEVERLGIKKNRITKVDTLRTSAGRVFLVHYR